MYNSIILENQTFKSEILGKEVLYSVYLPSDYYSESIVKYPVLYLLHGAGGDSKTWLDRGNIKHILDDKLSAREMMPFVVVMIDGGAYDDYGSKSFYINSCRGDFPFEDMFVDEFMPYVATNYKINANPSHSFIGGNSMGGYGALYYSLKYKNRFKACFSLSAALLNDETLKVLPDEMYDQYFGNMIGRSLRGEERYNEHYRAHSIFHLFDDQKDNKTKFYIECGDKDNRGDITAINMQLHIKLVKMGFDHEFRMEDGGHGWPYWRVRTGDALDFINRCFINKVR